MRILYRRHKMAASKTREFNDGVKNEEVLDGKSSQKYSGRLHKRGGKDNTTKANTDSGCDRSRNNNSSMCSSKSNNRSGDCGGNDVGGGSRSKIFQCKSSFKQYMKACLIAVLLTCIGFLLGFKSAHWWDYNKAIDQPLQNQPDHLYQHKQYQHPQGPDCHQQKHDYYANKGYQQNKVLNHQSQCQQQLSKNQDHGLREIDPASANSADNHKLSPTEENSKIKNIKGSHDNTFLGTNDILKTSNQQQTKPLSKRAVEDKLSENKPRENKLKSDLNKNIRTETRPKQEYKTKPNPLVKDSTSPFQKSLSNEPIKLGLNSGSNVIFNMSTKLDENDKSTTLEDQRKRKDIGASEESKNDENQTKPKTKNKTKKSKLVSKTTENSADEDLPSEVKNFKSTIQDGILPKKIFADGRRIPPIHLIPQKPNNSSVNVYMFEEFLSVAECDGLRHAHDKYVKLWSKKDPILCFNGIRTLREHLKHAGKGHINVSPLDFTEGTMCVNDTFSAKLKSWLKSRWNYNTAFYPGESRFSKVFERRVEQAMGLRPENGGKFQITSYPNGIGYNKHTDCQEANDDPRDRVATVLVYLETVAEGGETRFPELGIWVRPRKGRALLWNNMSKKGQCQSLSQHLADPVKIGSKYILQRWYYYQSFYSLGKRPPKPHLPIRDEYQPRVTCDDFDNESCRWYDDWNYDHLLQYRSIGKNLLI